MKKLIFIILVLFPGFFAKAQVLSVPVVIQEQSNWCWAGCSKCILSYYHNATTQCEIAELARTSSTTGFYGTHNCCINADSGCNNSNAMSGGPGTIQGILDHFDSIKSTSMGPLELYQIPDVINGKYPFVILWFWSGGGGHFVVGNGLVDSQVHYMDPWYGEGAHIATYNNVKNDGSHTWTETLILTSAPSTGVDNISMPATGISVAPNPISSAATVKLGAYHVLPCDLVICDVQGRVVYHVIANSLETTIHKNDLPAGMYILRVTDKNNQTSYTKVSVE